MRDRVRMRYGFLALLCAAAFVGLTALPVLAVREVAVLGARSADVAAVREAAALSGQNPFTASAVTAAERVRHVPGVQEARAGVVLPDSAFVEVTGRVPAVVLEFSGGWLYADAAGYLFTGDDRAGFPVLVDETRSYRAGERLDAGLIGSVRRVAALSDTSYFGSAIVRTRLSPTYGLVLVLGRGTEVRFGTSEEFDRKAGVAQRIVLERSGRRLDYVDVRSPDRVVFSPQD